MDYPESCDRCGAKTNLETGVPRRPMVLQFTTETEEGSYDSETRSLCDGCWSDLKQWIDNGDIDRSDCVDLPTKMEAKNQLYYAIENPERTIDELE